MTRLASGEALAPVNDGDPRLRLPTEAIVTRVARVHLDAKDIIWIVTDARSGEQGLADAREITQAVARLIGGRRVPLALDLRKGIAVSKAARAYYAGPESLGLHNAIAIIVGSPLSKLMGNLALKVLSLKIPARLVTSEEDAIAWLLQEAPR